MLKSNFHPLTSIGFPGIDRELCVDTFHDDDCATLSLFLVLPIGVAAAILGVPTARMYHRLRFAATAQFAKLHVSSASLYD